MKSRIKQETQFATAGNSNIRAGLTTASIEPFLKPKAALVKEKGLLIYEQPLQNLVDFNRSTPVVISVEPLKDLFSIISRFKIA